VETWGYLFKYGYWENHPQLVLKQCECQRARRRSSGKQRGNF